MVGHGGDKIHWVVPLTTERARQKGGEWQLRADPDYVELSPKCVIDTRLGDWMRRHRVRYLVLALFAFHGMIRVKVPGSESETVTFEDEQHTAWRRSWLWVMADVLVCAALLFTILHYTNRDLIRQQILAFDTVVIVGNAILWYVTRFVSEKAVFSGAFGTDDVFRHLIEALFVLPLTVIVACFDSVKMAHRTKILILMAMVLERGWQYYLYRDPRGVFADHGMCSTVVYQISCDDLLGIHLSSNTTIIIFLLKSIRAYALGNHFAVIKPRFRMMLRRDISDPTSSAQSASPYGALGQMAFDVVEDEEQNDQPATPRSGDAEGQQPTLQQAVIGRSFDALSTQTSRYSLHCVNSIDSREGTQSLAKMGTAGALDEQELPDLTDPASLELPAREDTQPHSDSVRRAPSSGQPSQSDRGQVTPPAEFGTETSGCHLPDLRAALRDMELAASTLRERMVAKGVVSPLTSGTPPTVQTPPNGEQADPPSHLEELPHEASFGGGSAVFKAVNAESVFTPVQGWEMKTAQSPGSNDRDMQALTKARDETKRVCQAYESDLLVFKAQLAILEQEIADLIRAAEHGGGVGIL